MGKFLFNFSVNHISTNSYYKLLSVNFVITVKITSSLFPSQMKGNSLMFLKLSTVKK